MPVGYGSTISEREPLVNGVPTVFGAQGATQRDRERSGAADVSGSGPSVTATLVPFERGARETGPERVAGYGAVQGRVGVEHLAQTSRPPEQHPPVHPAPADQQQPHTPAQRQHVPMQASTPLADGSLHGDDSGPLQGHTATAGTRLSVEAQRAMTQLASQRAALVHALQVRARGTLGTPEPQETGDPGDAGATLQERSYDNGEEVVWYSRLQGFLRRRVMEPVREQMETLRRSAPSASPATTWFGSPLPASDPLMSPTTRRAMQEWTERHSPLLTAPHQDNRTAGLTEEDIQGEVRRQVQSVMSDRDQQMQALQVENAELKNILTSVLERASAGESAQGSREGQARDRPRGPDGVESSGHLGAACGFPGQGQETSHGRSFGVAQRVPEDGRLPPGLPAPSRADLRPPPGLSVESRIDPCYPAGLPAPSRADLRQPVSNIVSGNEGHLWSLHEPDYRGRPRHDCSWRW